MTTSTQKDDCLDLYLMSPPAPSWRLRCKANFRSSDAEPVDAKVAIREWCALADAITEAGGSVLVLEPEENSLLTGLPYAAEAGQLVFVGDRPVFLLANMFAEHRRAEPTLWRQFAQKMGWSTHQAAAFWEGQGDVSFFSGRTMLFFGGRTTTHGLASVRHFFDPASIVIELRQPAFHGNMAVSPIAPAHKLLVCPPVMRADSLGELRNAFGANSLIEVTEEEITNYSTNGLCVGQTMIVPSITPSRIVDNFRDWGLRVVVLPMRELCEKAGGASRCLVCHVRLTPEQIARQTIPDQLRFENVKNRLLSTVAS